MKKVSKLPTKQLEKYSALFMQLGLVLTLFIVYLLLEHKTPKNTFAVFKPDIEHQVFFLLDDLPIVFKKKVSKTKKRILKKRVPVVRLNEIIKAENNLIEDVLHFPKDEVKTHTEDILKDYTEEKIDELEDDAHLFVFLEKTPVFKGCEGLSNKENKKCFDKKIRKFVQKNFDTTIAKDIGLSSGKYTIYTEFVIDKNGLVIDIKIRAPHKRLKKETEKIIKKLPLFTPGKQRNKPVKVKYTLPISFRVEY